MNSARPSIWYSVVAAYLDTFRAVTAMPAIAIVILVLSLFQSIVDLLFFRFLFPDILQFVANYFLIVIWSFLFTPALIAIHRFIILGNLTPGYLFELNDRFYRFLGWSLLVDSIFMLLLLPIALPEDTETIVLLLPIVCFLVGLYFVVRLTLLFPAIAVDAPNATWRSSLRDTKGHFWRILTTFLVAAAPLLAPLIFAASLEEVPDAASRVTPQGIIVATITGAGGAIFSALFVAIASRFYQWMGDRVKRSDGYEQTVR